MSKLFLCGITNGGNLDNLRDMIEPVKDHIDGLNFVFHYPKDDGADYLEKNKKDGKIVYSDWCQRHHYSMNHFLYQGNMKNGDFFILLDSGERISKECAEKAIPEFIRQMKEKNICMISNYNKGFLFRYDESMEFKGSPHWYMTVFTGVVTNLELPDTLFKNVRNQTRNKFHFVDHYAKYMLYPYGSNHALLGLENKEQFIVRDKLRLDFRDYLSNELGLSLTVEALKQFLLENKTSLPDKLKFFINKEKVWNDFYRFHILDDRSFVDDHNHSNIVEI